MAASLFEELAASPDEKRVRRTNEDARAIIETVRRRDGRRSLP